MSIYHMHAMHLIHREQKVPHELYEKHFSESAEVGIRYAAAKKRLEVNVPNSEDPKAIAKFVKSRANAFDALHELDMRDNYAPAQYTLGMFDVKRGKYRNAFDKFFRSGQQNFKPAQFACVKLLNRFSQLPADEMFTSDWLADAAQPVPIPIAAKDSFSIKYYIHEPANQALLQKTLKQLKKTPEQWREEQQENLYQQGQAYYEDGNYAETRMKLELCTDHPGALLLLGTMYVKGQGVKKDVDKAYKFFNHKSLQNDAAALYNKSKLLIEEKQDYKKGTACLLRILRHHDINVNSDLLQNAQRTLTKLVNEEHHIDAIEAMIPILLNGECGFEQDINQAFELFLENQNKFAAPDTLIQLFEKVASDYADITYELGTYFLKKAHENPKLFQEAANYFDSVAKEFPEGFLSLAEYKLLQSKNAEEGVWIDNVIRSVISLENDQRKIQINEQLISKLQQVAKATETEEKIWLDKAREHAASFEDARRQTEMNVQLAQSAHAETKIWIDKARMYATSLEDERRKMDINNQSIFMLQQLGQKGSVEAIESLLKIHQQEGNLLVPIVKLCNDLDPASKEQIAKSSIFRQAVEDEIGRPDVDRKLLSQIEKLFGDIGEVKSVISCKKKAAEKSREAAWDLALVYARNEQFSECIEQVHDALKMSPDMDKQMILEYMTEVEKFVGQFSADESYEYAQLFNNGLQDKQRHRKFLQQAIEYGYFSHSQQKIDDVTDRFVDILFNPKKISDKDQEIVQDIAVTCLKRIKTKKSGYALAHWYASNKKLEELEKILEDINQNTLVPLDDTKKQKAQFKEFILGNSGDTIGQYALEAQNAKLCLAWGKALHDGILDVGISDKTIIRNALGFLTIAGEQGIDDARKYLIHIYLHNSDNEKYITWGLNALPPLIKYLQNSNDTTSDEVISDIFNQLKYISKNNGKAALMLARACEAGVARYIPQDDSQCLDYICQAAKFGEILGLYKLAQGYEIGKYGLSISSSQAVEYYGKILEAKALTEEEKNAIDDAKNKLQILAEKEPTASYALLKYFYGNNQLDKMYEYWDRAEEATLDREISDDCNELSLVITTRALDVLDKQARENKDLHAAVKLAQLYINRSHIGFGNGHHVTLISRLLKLAEYIQLAHANGYTKEMRMKLPALATIYYEISQEFLKVNDKEKQEEYLKLAAESDHQQALFDYGVLCINKSDVELIKKGMDCLTKFVDKKNESHRNYALALGHLGHMLWTGGRYQYPERDRKLGYQYLQKSAELGSRVAQEFLNSIPQNEIPVLKNENPHSQMQAAVSAYYDKEYEKAEVILQDQKESDSESWYYLAKIYKKQNKKDDAVTYFVHYLDLVKKGDNVIDAFIELKNLADNGHIAACYELCTLLKPVDGILWIPKTANHKLTRNNILDPDRCFKRIEQHMQEEQTPEGSFIYASLLLSKYMRAVQDQNTDTVRQLDNTILDMVESHLQRAMKYEGKDKLINEQIINCWLQVVNIAEKLERWQKAYSACDSILKINPDNKTALDARLHADLRMGNKSKMEDLKKVAVTGNWSAQLTHGHRVLTNDTLVQNKKDRLKAIKNLKEVITEQAAPQHMRQLAGVLLGDFYSKENKGNNAETALYYFLQAQEFGDASPSTVLKIGAMNLKLKRFDEGYNVFKKIKEQSPNEALPILTNLCLRKNTPESIAEALSYFEQLLDNLDVNNDTKAWNAIAIFEIPSRLANMLNDEQAAYLYARYTHYALVNSKKMREEKGLQNIFNPTNTINLLKQGMNMQKKNQLAHTMIALLFLEEKDYLNSFRTLVRVLKNNGITIDGNFAHKRIEKVYTGISEVLKTQNTTLYELLEKEKAKIIIENAKNHQS